MPPLPASASPLVARVAYWNEPEAVVWVDLGHRRLQGYDNYWLAGNRYGVWNDPENMGSMYEGIAGAAWQYSNGIEQPIDPTPTPDARIWRGVMLTDEQARFVGLI